MALIKFIGENAFIFLISHEPSQFKKVAMYTIVFLFCLSSVKVLAQVTTTVGPLTTSPVVPENCTWSKVKHVQYLYSLSHEDLHRIPLEPVTAPHNSLWITLA